LNFTTLFGSFDSTCDYYLNSSISTGGLAFFAQFFIHKQAVSNNS